MSLLRCDGTAVLGPTEQVPAKGLQLCQRPLSRPEVTCACLQWWSSSGMGIQAAKGKAKWGQKGYQIHGMNECNKGPKPHSKSLAWHDVLPFSLSLFCFDCFLWGLLWYFPKFCKFIELFSFLGVHRAPWYKVFSNRKIWAILCWAAGVPTGQQRNLYSSAAPGVSGNGEGLKQQCSIP